MTLRPYRPKSPFFYRELGIRWSSSGYPCQVVFLSFQTSTYHPLSQHLCSSCLVLTPRWILAQAEGRLFRGGRPFGRAALSLARACPHLPHWFPGVIGQSSLSGRSIARACSLVSAPVSFTVRSSVRCLDPGSGRSSVPAEAPLDQGHGVRVHDVVNEPGKVVHGRAIRNASQDPLCAV